MALTGAAKRYWQWRCRPVATETRYDKSRALLILWSWDLTTHQWTWVNGSSSGNASGVYGTLNVAAPTNSPGGRLLPSGWIDASNRLPL